MNQGVGQPPDCGIWSAYSIYHVFCLYQSQKYPLERLSYVLCSALRDLAVQPPARLTEAQLSQTLGRLALLHEAEGCKNPFLVSRAARMIDREYAAISLARLAERLQVSPAYLSGAISESTGCTFCNILFCRRLFSFVSLVLANPALPLEDVAYRLGYKSVHYFCRNFKQHVGLTPSSARYLLQDIHLAQADAGA